MASSKIQSGYKTATVTGTTGSSGNIQIGLPNNVVIGAKNSETYMALPFWGGWAGWYVKVLVQSTMSPVANQEVTITFYYL